MSILSDIDRISAALEAVEDGKANIAEAITAKGVDTLPDSTFDTLALNIGLISGGGGGNTWTKLLDLSSDMTLKDVLTNHPIDLKGKDNCIVNLIHTGNNTTPTGITYSCMFFVINGLPNLIGTAYATTTGLAPTHNIANYWYVTSGANGSYFAVTNGKITATSTTNTTRKFPSGNTLYYSIIDITDNGQTLIR